MAEQAKAGDVVAIHYTGKLQDGSVFDTSRERGEPLEFEVGSGQVIPGFDQAVSGMSVGEERNVHIPPEQAYGERREDLQVSVPRAQFPAGMDPQVGQTVGVQVAPGQQAPARVVDVEDRSVTLDLNHPLAGETLIFDIELVDIRGE